MLYRVYVMVQQLVVAGGLAGGRVVDEVSVAGSGKRA